MADQGNLPSPKIIEPPAAMTLPSNRRHSSSSAMTPPKSPSFCIHKPPSSPGGLSVTGRSGSGNIDQHSLSPMIGRFFGSLSPTTSKKVCTMDCAHCRHMARNSRSGSPNFAECVSAPCSRKSSIFAAGKLNKMMG